MAKSFFRRYKPVILASPLLAAPFGEYWLRSQDVSGFVSDTGVVVGHVEVRPPMSFLGYRSVIQFRGRDGSEARFVDDIDRRPAEPIGKKVPVLVEPRERAIAYRGGLRGHWFGVMVTAVVSWTMFGGAALVTWLTRGRASRRLARRKAGRHGQTGSGRTTG